MRLVLARKEEVVVGPIVPSHTGQMRTAPASLVVARTALFELLSTSGTHGVTLVSAPAGSGKTVLLRSWIQASALADRVAWVSVERGERDGQRFWLSVFEQLGPAVGEGVAFEKLTPTPDFDGEAVVGRLVSQLGSLEQPVVLVIDDLHELGSQEALAQLELLLARRPPLLRIVLATRHDPQLGLHRLRLTGELTEVRASDLRFTLEETRDLLAAAGITLSSESLARLHARAEGWAAGLRLAALSLAGHPDPDGFVTEFSGSERTVAEYLLAEVLGRQPSQVRSVLLRTSILERVNGALADVLAESSGSEAILQALEQANAFVVSLDAGRTWFRYHQLFADLLRLELRRTEPGTVVTVHRAAAEWFAEHGYVVEAVRHAQAAGDWPDAARLLADNLFSLFLNGQGGTLAALAADFPAEEAADPEVALLFADAELAQGSVERIALFLDLAERNLRVLPEERRLRFEVRLAATRLTLASRQGDFGSVVADVQSLLAPVEAETVSEVALGSDAKLVALLALGIAELWSFRFDEAERHLVQALELSRDIERPYIAIIALGHLALLAGRVSLSLERERSEEALAIAKAHGWASDPTAFAALVAKGSAETYGARFEAAQHWLERAERGLRPRADPGNAALLHVARGMLHAGRGQLELALAEFHTSAGPHTLLVTPNLLGFQARQFLVHTQLRLGELAAARATAAGFSDQEREWGEAPVAIAALRLAEGDPQGAIDSVTPVLNGRPPVFGQFSVVQAFLVRAAARDQLGARLGAESDVESALSLAEPDALIFPFLVTPVGDLLERHPRHRTAHAALLTDILDVVSGSSLPAEAPEPEELDEDLSQSELRVLGYLPSNLSAPEIASELFLSVSTVKTHMRHIYAKLGVHRRTEAVERARSLGLLGRSPKHHR